MQPNTKMPYAHLDSKRPIASIAPDADTGKIITIASVIIILAIVLIGSLSYNISKNAAINKLKTKDLIHIADAISSKVDSRIERAKEVALVLAADPQIKDWIQSSAKESDTAQRKHVLGKIGALVKNFDYTNSFIVSAVTGHYWDETGRIIDTVSKADPDDDWFFATLSSKTPVSISFDYNRERQDTFVFVNALVGDVKAPLGVTGVGLGLGRLSEEIRAIKYGQNSDLWLVDKAGMIYLSDNIGDEGSSLAHVLPTDTLDELLGFIREGKSAYNVLEYKSKDSVLIDLIIQPLRSTEWFLVLQLPRNESIGFLSAIKINTVLASLIIFVSLILLFYFLSTRLVDPYKKAIELNRELEAKVVERTRELHEQNTKLIDSINYAQRIQQAILPSTDALNELFEESFLIWQPRDTVGGDFYWIKQLDQGFLVAVADCTGHGVPGALVSVISVTLLNRIVDRGETQPGNILNQLHALLQETLGQKGATAVANDGLDIGLLHFDGRDVLTFAGARTCLYVKSSQQLQVLNGDRRSIGGVKATHDGGFKSEVVNWQRGDFFYITTDGFIEQNGGPKNYSYGRSAFVELINECYPQPLSLQRELFLQALANHMGDELQRDDIAVMAFKVR